MKFKFRNVTGMPITPRGTVKSIFTILLVTCVLGGYKLDILYFWFAYLVIDKVGEWTANSYWTKPIGENPLRPNKI
jgi:hypothetical protein